MTQPDDQYDGGTESPSTLCAVIRAAHIARDRDLERLAKRELRLRYGMRVTFERQTAEVSP